MQICESIAAVRRVVTAARSSGQRVALVPTMGFLHAGHVSLMRLARQHADCVITSIFVNPTQFAAGEDLDRYPRDREGDLAKCEAAGCAAVFMPSNAIMYPPGAQTQVVVPDLASPLCGASRPGHFTGVATVVLKLLNIVGPAVAIFGEKDYQQLAVIRCLVRDLNVPVEIVGGPIVREVDGLAMSSRNAYLDDAQRRAAPAIHAGLRAAEALWNAGERDPRTLEAGARAIIDAVPGSAIEYVEVRDADDLSALTGPVDRPVVLAVAVRFGTTRLIDNQVLR